MKTLAPTVDQVDVAKKNILVRCDLEGDADSPRFLATRNVVAYLQQQGAERIKVIGHDGDIWMASALGVDINWDLRRDPREKENSVEYAAELARGFDVYINEAFATSHREHASIVALPKLMKSEGKPVALGLRFQQELEILDKLAAGSSEGRILVIGGVKVEDKNRYVKLLENKFDAILKGGLLDGSPQRADGLDISTEAIEDYKQQISKATTIVAAGVMGKYEEAGSESGTKEVLLAITNAQAYKVAGGGDLEAAIDKYNLSSKFDWISVGGGAMLEFLANGTLPGIEALLG